MNINEKRKAFEKLLAGAPEVMSPLQVSKWTPYGRNTVYDMLRSGELRYNKDYLDYVNVDAIGNIYNPDYVSEHFAVLLKRHGLRKIRFHDLRHSCASTLLALGKQMKDIQMWLGYSDIGTTGNIYSHLDSHSKAQTGAAIYDALTD